MNVVEDLRFDDLALAPLQLVQADADLILDVAQSARLDKLPAPQRLDLGQRKRLLPDCDLLPGEDLIGLDQCLAPAGGLLFPRPLLKPLGQSFESVSLQETVTQPGLDKLPSDYSKLDLAALRFLRLPWSTVLTGAALFFVFSVFLAAVQFATPNLAGNDGYYHIKLAYLMRTEGLKPPFPWLPLTILNEGSFVDHHYLYHILLVPFTFGDLRLGAKIAGVGMFRARLTVLDAIHERIDQPRRLVLGHLPERHPCSVAHIPIAAAVDHHLGHQRRAA